MLDLAPSVQQSLILFVLMAAGYTAGKLGIFSDEAIRGISRFVVDFTLPALILISMQQPFSPELRNQAFKLLAISSAVYALSLALAYCIRFIFRSLPPRELAMHRFALCFSNVGFMGFPVCEAILGKESLFSVSVYNIPFQILVFSVGTVMIAGTSKRQINYGKIVANPAVLSALAGFALFLFSARIPEPFFTSFTMLGSITTPLAMTLVGAILAGTRAKGMFTNPAVWFTSAYRLLLHPLLILAALRFFGFSGFDAAVPVLIAAMPVAVNSTILAKVYGGDEVSASQLVFVTTLASLITIPLITRLY